MELTLLETLSTLMTCISSSLLDDEKDDQFSVSVSSLSDVSIVTTLIFCFLVGGWCLVLAWGRGPGAWGKLALSVRLQEQLPISQLALENVSEEFGWLFFQQSGEFITESLLQNSSCPDPLSMDFSQLTL